MDIDLFQRSFTTFYKDQNGQEILFDPLDKNYEYGYARLNPKSDSPYSIQYAVRQDEYVIWVNIFGKEYLFRETENGFDLLDGKAVGYSFTRI